ncbi:MAG: hypothetical protein ACK4NC_01040 [Candidatus Gracilibacteria bacterium]
MMETLILQKQEILPEKKDPLKTSIEIQLPLKEFHTSLLKFTNLDKDQEKDLLSEMVERNDMRLDKEKGKNDTSNKVEKFSTIKNSLIKEKESPTALMAWIKVLLHDLIDEANVYEEYDAVSDAAKKISKEKYELMDEYIYAQLHREIQNNICSKGEFLFNFMKIPVKGAEDRKLASKEDILYILGLSHYKLSEVQKLVNDFSKSISVREEKTSLLNVLNAIEMMSSKKVTKDKIKDEFILAVNSYIEDNANYSVYDTFSWYLMKGHKQVYNLDALHIDVENEKEFKAKNGALLSSINEKFERTSYLGEKDNFITKVDVLRKLYNKAVLDGLLNPNDESAVVELKYTLDLVNLPKDQKEVNKVRIDFDVKDADLRSLLQSDENITAIDQKEFACVKNAIEMKNEALLLQKVKK